MRRVTSGAKRLLHKHSSGKAPVSHAWPAGPSRSLRRATAAARSVHAEPFIVDNRFDVVREAFHCQRLKVVIEVTWTGLDTIGWGVGGFDGCVVE
jgi:hypothetical protein